jgi:Spy/CpxP family protein refolding chaperone
MGPMGGMGMGGGIGQLFEAPISTRDLQKYAEMLSLTPEQRETLEILLEASQQEFSEKAGEARRKLEALREEAREARDPSVWRDMGVQMDAFRKARATMEAGFFNDMKALLTPAQAEKFPRIERQRRREQTIGLGLMSGERADLVRITADLQLSDDQLEQIRPILDQYEADLDRELQNRNAVYEESQGRIREMFERGGTDDMQRALERGREASMRVRDVNRRYARQIESVLPDGARERFVEQVRRESFPMIYRPSHALRVIEAAAAFADLDDNQRAAISSIRDSFVRESAALNRQLEQATIKNEETLTVQDMMSRGFRAAGGNDDMEALRDKRRELESSTVEKVRAVLSPEQIERLPRRDERQGGMDRGEPRRGQPPQRRGRGGEGEGENAPPRRPDSRT